MNQSSKIVFFGSGPVARATLESLIKHFAIEAIVTKPRAPHHHGEVPVLEFAEKHAVKTLTPTNKRELTEAFSTMSFDSTVGIVVDYGIIIDVSVINAFAKGIINSHFSLLPQWRGADPITFSVLSGQKQTGVSLMLINEKMDDGPLLAQEPLAIEPTDTTPRLTEKLIGLSNQMLAKHLPEYLSGQIEPAPQTSRGVSYSRKLTKEDGLLDQSKTAAELEREVRAFYGWPKSRTNFFGPDIVVLKTRAATTQPNDKLVLPCANNTYLIIDELIGPSGRKMDGASFVNGYLRK